MHLAAVCWQRHPYARVFFLSLHHFKLHRLCVEFNSVRLNFGRTDHFDVAADGINGAVAPLEQVEVAGRAVGVLRPKTEEHRAFEDVAVVESRLAEPVEKTLEEEIYEKPLVVVSRLASALQDSGRDGRGEVAFCFGPRHRTESM